MDMTTTMDVSAKGMAAQNTRLRVIAENLANAVTMGSTPGADPYQRKTVTFENRLDKTLGTNVVSVAKIAHDKTAFPQKYAPANPAADATGYVKTPNVTSFVEVMDMKEAQRGYSANLNVLETTRGMMMHTLDLLK